MTHRQYTTWVEWLFMRANDPSVTEQYIMQNTAMIQRVNSKKGAKITTSDFKISFVRTDKDGKPVKENQTPTDKEAQTKVAKAVWAKRLGGNIKHVTISREEAVARGLITEE